MGLNEIIYGKSRMRIGSKMEPSGLSLLRGQAEQKGPVRDQAGKASAYRKYAITNPRQESVSRRFELQGWHQEVEAYEDGNIAGV